MWVPAMLHVPSVQSFTTSGRHSYCSRVIPHGGLQGSGCSLLHRPACNSTRELLRCLLALLACHGGGVGMGCHGLFSLVYEARSPSLPLPPSRPGPSIPISKHASMKTDRFMNHDNPCNRAGSMYGEYRVLCQHAAPSAPPIDQSMAILPQSRLALRRRPAMGLGWPSTFYKPHNNCTLGVEPERP